jgi:glycosyltransferase involved in cell wall biosynthesis
MNILLINHYAGSPELGMEFRPFYMSREWARLGHKVFILAADFTHVRSRQPEVKHDLERNITEGIEYIWLKTLHYSSSGIRRILNMLMFIFKLLIYNKRISSFSVPDVVIASSTYPLDIFPAYMIARRRKAKLVFEVHDLWPLSPQELGGYSKFHPFIIAMQIAENFAYRHCHKVVSMIPLAKTHMVEHGLDYGKFCYIPNGIVLDDWNEVKALPEEYQNLIDSLRREGKFLVGYAGSHGVANSLQAVIDAVTELRSNNVALILLGIGPEKTKLISNVEKSGTKNIYFLKPLIKSSVPAFLKQMDALYIGLKKQPIFRFGISPNKIFDYMMASKPIIQAIEAGNNLVLDANCGFYAEPDNSHKIAEAILALQNMTVTERDILGENGYRFVNKYHTYYSLARSFLEVFDNKKE